MSLRDAMKRVASTTLQPFVAPVVEAQSVTIATLQNGAMYQFRVAAPVPGWYQFAYNPKTKRIRSAPLALIANKFKYLNSLRRFFVLAVRPLSESAWLVVPRHSGDVLQRQWIRSQPRPMHLVNGSVLPLDTVVARDAGGVLVFDQVDTRSNQSENRELRRRILNNGDVTGKFTPELQLAASIIVAEREVARAEARRVEAEARRAAAQAEVEARRSTLEGRIMEQLDFMGARLETWNNTRNGLEITWEFNGYTHRAIFQPDLTVSSAGFCLSGTDSSHNLMTLISTVEQARRLHRHDIDRAAWLEVEETDPQEFYEGRNDWDDDD